LKKLGTLFEVLRGDSWENKLTFWVEGQRNGLLEDDLNEAERRILKNERD
jgi:hypothetical protein